MSTPPQLPATFLELLNNSSLEVKRLMQEALTDSITKAESVSSALKSNTDVQPKDFVTHVEDLHIDKCLSAAIQAELESLNLHSLPQKNKVKTQWLSPSNEDYNYGSIVNKPKPISEYPAICKLMDLVNDQPSTTGDMDAAHISCFPTRSAKLRLHTDNEPLISQSSSICTVSFGPPRMLEFVKISKTVQRGKQDYGADLSLPATQHSMNVMRPGCQQVLKHRVIEGVHITGQSNVRFSISFRKINTPSDISHDAVSNSQAKTAKTTPPPAPPKVKETVILMAGDSFFERLDAKRLGKGKRTVVNIAKGGSKIDKVLKSISDFVKDNPDKAVSKCFISIGTNDIRHCTTGVKHLKSPLCNFMRSVKESLPYTKIYFQSLIPIPCNGSHHVVNNIYEMNDLLFNLCSRYKLLYVDTFNLFIDNFGRRNLSLFPGYNSENKFLDIHPNKRGMGVLARTFIFLIHSKWFNPLGY